MTISENYPSAQRRPRQLDAAVHAIGLVLIIAAGGLLISRARHELSLTMAIAVSIYVISILASNQASVCYHFAPWHDRRQLLRRVDHAAIYLSICGTLTPLFIHAGTDITMSLLVLCWALAGFGIWTKITHESVKKRWSTLSYVGLGNLGLVGLIGFTDMPRTGVWLICLAAACYGIGILFYGRKSLPYRYAIWHLWVNLGAMSMFALIWVTLFSP